MLTNKFDLDPTKNPTTHDPVINYSFQIQITGYDQYAKEYMYWWHLDKNIKSDAPKFTHPYYHFQAGGNEIEMKDTGELLMLGAPRIPHPPMDIFLGIHFIINNFLSTKDYPSVKTMFEDYDYQEVIKSAQKRMWEPYFSAYLFPNSNSDFTFKNVFPLYI